MPRAAGVQIVQEYGLISATFTRIKASATFSLAKWASDNAVEAESARAMALGKLRTKAKAAGANAVVDIASNYKHVEYKDSQKYECHAGAIMAGVAIKGNLAKVK